MWSGLALKRASLGYPTAKKGQSTESAVRKEQAESAHILKEPSPTSSKVRRQRRIRRVPPRRLDRPRSASETWDRGRQKCEIRHFRRKDRHSSADPPAIRRDRKSVV